MWREEEEEGVGRKAARSPPCCDAKWRPVGGGAGSAASCRFISPHVASCRPPAYGINSILYQRGIYPPETFTRVQKYGLTLLVTTDPELKNYLNNVVEQMKGARGGGWRRKAAAWARRHR